VSKGPKRKRRKTARTRPGRALVPRGALPDPVEDYQPVHVDPPFYEPVAEYYPPAPQLSPFEKAIRRISGIEIAGLVGLCYICCVGSFNAGYFVHVSGRFVELFSFSDVLGANIALVQYIFLVVSTWCTFSIAWTTLTYHFRFEWAKRVRDSVESFVLSVNADFGRYLFAFGVFLLVLFLAFALSSMTNHRFLAVDLFPMALFQGGILYVAWRGFKAGYVSVQNLAIALVLGILFFSYEAGKVWLKFDINNPAGVQSVFTKEDRCLDRKILRTSSNGLLLYNPFLKSFEFRNKDDIKVIYDRRGCA
jgi:hypothetical protein